MLSSFTWLDYSEYDHRKMLDVIDLFGGKTKRDELGLGGVRDAFADLLFPGTPTIQTVAKYFLFVPWMCMDPAKHQDILGFVFEFSTRDTFGRASRVIKTQTRLTNPTHFAAAPSSAPPRSASGDAR
jgi:hypothetical protein